MYFSAYLINYEMPLLLAGKQFELFCKQLLSHCIIFAHIHFVIFLKKYFKATELKLFCKVVLVFTFLYEAFYISATWKIIQAFLSFEQRQKLLMLKKKDLKKYIPEAGTWWEHMKEKEKK